MPFDCRIEPERRLGWIVLTGTVDGEGFLEAMEALYRHPDWQPGFSALWDARRLGQLLLEPADMHRILAAMQALASQMGQGRAAFVVPREIDYTIARLFIYRGATGERERRTFGDVDEALRWLAGA